MSAWITIRRLAVGHFKMRKLVCFLLMQVEFMYETMWRAGVITPGGAFVNACTDTVRRASAAHVFAL
jgi:hypothetical protein